MQRIASLGFVLWLFCASTLPAAWRDAYEATVRVERPGAAGSGVVFHADGQFIWVLTNAHVTGRRSTVFVVPFTGGVQRQRSLGRVTLRAYTGQLDAAVVRVDRRYWTGGTKAVPLSLRVPRPGEEIITVGCPRADWPSLWHGRITRVDYPTLYFFPGQATGLDLMSGRSGSAICNAAGTEVVGLFTWGINRQGGGQVMRFVIEQLWRRRRSVAIPSWEPQQRLPRHLIPAAELPEPAGELVPVSGMRETQSGCWPRLPWRPGRPPQPQPPTVPPAPSPGESGPVLPEVPGTNGPADENTARKLAQLESRLNSLEATLAELRKGYEDIRRQWPQVREVLLGSKLPEAEKLVARIEQLDQQLRQSVVEAEDAARRAAQQETKGLKERVAELLGRVDAMKQAVGLVSQYVASRQEGSGPKAALAQALDSKLSSLEQRLESRIENLNRSDVATALTYVGVPSLAATIISFFLAGALRRKGDDALQLLFKLLHSKLDPEPPKKGK